MGSSSLAKAVRELDAWGRSLAALQAETARRGWLERAR